jgi:hypothetical protein
VIDFGDDARSGMGAAASGDCPAALLSYTTHTYTTPGTYRLRGSACPSSALHRECGDAAAQAGTVTITVTRAP